MHKRFKRPSCRARRLLPGVESRLIRLRVHRVSHHPNPRMLIRNRLDHLRAGINRAPARLGLPVAAALDVVFDAHLPAVGPARPADLEDAAEAQHGVLHRHARVEVRNCVGGLAELDIALLVVGGVASLRWRDANRHSHRPVECIDQDAAKSPRLGHTCAQKVVAQAVLQGPHVREPLRHRGPRAAPQAPAQRRVTCSQPSGRTGAQLLVAFAASLRLRDRRVSVDLRGDGTQGGPHRLARPTRR